MPLPPRLQPVRRSEERHQGVVMTGRKLGDEGAEKHSVDVADPAGVCVDPEFGYPFHTPLSRC